MRLFIHESGLYKETTSVTWYMNDQLLSARATFRAPVASASAARPGGLGRVNSAARARPSGAEAGGSRRRYRRSARNLVQEYIYEIICIKILAPIFTIALIFLHAGLIFYSD